LLPLYIYLYVNYEVLPEGSGSKTADASFSLMKRRLISAISPKSGSAPLAAVNGGVCGVA
jgi:hypothetical protein